MIGISYCTCVFLVTRPFIWYRNFLPRELDLEVWPTFENFNLGHNFLTTSDRAFILHMCIPLVTRPFTLKFGLLLKNFNLSCYLMMVAAREASLSSDNYISTTWWVSLLVGQWVLEGTCSQTLRSILVNLESINSVKRASKLSVLNWLEFENFVSLLHLPVWLQLVLKSLGYRILTLKILYLFS